MSMNITFNLCIYIRKENREEYIVNCRLTDLRHKEVISSCDGARIGFVDDVIVDTKLACIVSFVIFGRSGFFGIFGRCEDYIIPWAKIELIGTDTIIISCKTPNPVKRRKKPHFFEKNRNN